VTSQVGDGEVEVQLGPGDQPGSGLGRQAMARGALPNWIGLWWVHLTVVLLAAVILLLPIYLARRRYQRNNARLATVHA